MGRIAMATGWSAVATGRIATALTLSTTYGSGAVIRATAGESASPCTPVAAVAGCRGGSAASRDGPALEAGR